MLIPTVNALTVNTNWNVTAPRQTVRQLQYVAYLHNSIIAQQTANLYEYKF